MEGDRIFVSKFIYHFREPQVGDVIVFKGVEDRKKDLIKRLIAKEDDTLEITNGRIRLNSEIIDTPSVSEFNYGDFGLEGQRIEIPKGALYVLGDNSAKSRDSRYWGFVPRKNLIGKAVLIYWPLKRMQLIK